MRWLVRLRHPTRRDRARPFSGSGTTVEACIIEGAEALLHEAGLTTSGRYGIWGGLTPNNAPTWTPAPAASLITCPRMRPEPGHTSTPRKPACDGRRWRC